MADNKMASGTEIVFKKLKAAVAEPRLVTYGELADAAGLQPRIIGRRLDDIHTRLCQKNAGTALAGRHRRVEDYRLAERGPPGAAGQEHRAESEGPE